MVYLDSQPVPSFLPYISGCVLAVGNLFLCALLCVAQQDVGRDAEMQDEDLLKLVVSRQRINRWGAQSIRYQYRRKSLDFRSGNKSRDPLKAKPVESITEGFVAYTTSDHTLARKVHSYKIVKADSPACWYKYVLNGNYVCTAFWNETDEHRDVTYGYGERVRTELMPQDPAFEIIDEGIGLRLMNLSREEGRIVSVQRQEDNPSLVQIVRKKVWDHAKGKTAGLLHTVVYSLEEGGLARQLRVVSFGTDTPEHTLGASTENVKISRFVSNGHEVFLPVSVVMKTTRGGMLEFVIELTVNESSVQINTPLPNRLFELPMEPSDRVALMDLSLPVQAPGIPRIVLPEEDFIDQSTDDNRN